MSTTNERNERVRKILASLYERAISTTVEIDESAYQDSMKKLFSTTAWGFREILLVVIVGMRLDRSFKASTGLYDCNPRAIYEGPIKEFLLVKKLPHRKSGPLNVAKATVGLDMTWAAQRRPSDVAEAVVALVNFMEGNAARIDDIGISILRRLVEHSATVGELEVEIDPKADPEFLYHLCYELTTKAPDAGNTPQKIAAYLLKNYHLFLHTGVVVTGEEDRASVTSTTSKKPGDINEENPAGIVRKVYEITVKHFDLARIRDSYDCVSFYNEANNADIHEIIVICRKEDCPSDMKISGLRGYLGSYVYQDMMYYYWDIFEWYANTLQRMTADARIGFYLNLNAYINDFNTAERVKKLWRELHQSE